MPPSIKDGMKGCEHTTRTGDSVTVVLTVLPKDPCPWRSKEWLNPWRQRVD